jgi:hypothetical protein
MQLRDGPQSGQPYRNYVGLSGKKQGIEPGFPMNEGQIKILNGGFRLDVATTPNAKCGYVVRFLARPLLARTLGDERSRREQPQAPHNFL